MRASCHFKASSFHDCHIASLLRRQRRASKSATSADLSTADLDAIVQRVIAQEHVVGASVLVARGDRILLHKGYGFADLGTGSAGER